MSVGYDLEGIKSPKVDAYIEGMKDASGSDVWNECRAWALANLDKFEHVDAAFVESIPARVSNSITESTLHGCPPAEIGAHRDLSDYREGSQHLHQVQPHAAGL